MKYNYENIAFNAIKERVKQLNEIKTDRRYWFMTDGWEVKEASKLVKNVERVKIIAKEISKASMKFLKIVYIDRLYHKAIRTPVIKSIIGEFIKI